MTLNARVNIDAIKEQLAQPSIVITSISPAEELLESSPLTITWEITAGTNAFEGYVAFDGPPAVGDMRSRTRDVTLAPGQATRGSVVGLAPKAGTSVPVGVSVYPRGVEFAEAVATDQRQIEIGARYEFRVDYFVAETTRDNYLRGQGQDPKDYVVAACTAMIGGSPLRDPDPIDPNIPLAIGPETGTQFESYGWLDSGSRRDCDIRFMIDRSVPGKSAELTVQYDVVRAANAAQSLDEERKVANGILDINKGIATAILPQAGAAWEGVNVVMGALVGLATADCDGPLAGDSFRLESAQLADLTDRQSSDSSKDLPNEPHLRRIHFLNGPGWYGEERTYMGTNSPMGCGRDTSLYRVRFTLDRISHPNHETPPS